MDVRLPAPVGRPPRIVIVAVLVGAVLLSAPLLAIATQGLDPLHRLNALMLALAGLVILVWGVRRVIGPRQQLRHHTDLRLDHIGVTMLGAGSGAQLAWSDLALVEVRWWEIVPPYVDEECHLPVLRFVARDDGDIAISGLGPLAAPLGHAFGIPPAAAALTVVLGPDALEPLQQVLDWLADHRADVAVEVGAPPAL